MTPTDILGPPAVELLINHQLHKGNHQRDVPSRKKLASQKGKLKGKVSETITKS